MKSTSAPASPSGSGVLALAAGGLFQLQARATARSRAGAGRRPRPTRRRRPAVTRPGQGQEELQHPVHPGRRRATSSTSPCSAASRPRRPSSASRSRRRARRSSTRPCRSPILDSVVATKPDAILIAPTDVTAMQAPLQAAAAAGIKVILVDTTTKDPSYAASAIASDNEGGGKAAFEAIKQLNPNGGKVMMMSVDPGISTTDARAKGFEDAVKADSKFDYVGIQYSHDDPATASNLMGSALQKDPDIVGVFADQPLRRRGQRQRRQAGRQDGHGEDRQLRRRAQPGQGPQRRHRSRHSSPSSRGRSASTGSTWPSPRSTAAPSRRRSRPAPPSSPRTTSTATAARPSTSPAAELAENRPGRPPVARLGDARPATGG